MSSDEAPGPGDNLGNIASGDETMRVTWICCDWGSRRSVALQHVDIEQLVTKDVNKEV